MTTGAFILGNQLFPAKYLKALPEVGLSKGAPIFMSEDRELCTYFKFHQHKIILFLSAMRHQAKDLEKEGFQVEYIQLLAAHGTYESRLEKFIRDQQLTKIVCFEIEDKFFEERLFSLFDRMDIEVEVLPSPMFVTSRGQFNAYLDRVKKPFMKTFYESQRKRLDILMEDDKTPVGGKFSFDTDNRKPMPSTEEPPKPPIHQPDAIDREVMALVAKEFADHPGHAKSFWLPTSRRQALIGLNAFLSDRFAKYGDYQDAIVTGDNKLYHAIISPAMNLGLLPAEEIVERALAAYRKGGVPLNSIEGFIRQVIGWREFVRGVYRRHSERMESRNQWQATRAMKDCWYDGTTGLPPVDASIKHAANSGYCHHIERLMVLGNIMNLCEIKPKQVYSWFMEMFVDSSDWVMVPNVYGMGLVSDGGTFATKPYVSGSNYIRKMSNFPKGEWTDEWDGLYWRFIAKHRDHLERNARMGIITKGLGRMNSERRERLEKAATAVLKRTTTAR